MNEQTHQRPAQEGRLANENFALNIDPVSGTLCSIFDKRFDTEYIQVPHLARLFRLIMPLPDWRAHHIDSWQQPAPQITQDEQRLTLTYTSLTSDTDTFPVQVTVEFSLEAGSEEIPSQIHIVNNSEHEITDVMFPWLAGLGQITDPQQDCFVIPQWPVKK
jgi:hypothetical protein